jgi:hypothetical protein
MPNVCFWPISACRDGQQAAIENIKAVRSCGVYRLFLIEQQADKIPAYPYGKNEKNEYRRKRYRLMGHGGSSIK